MEGMMKPYIDMEIQPKSSRCGAIE